MTVNDTQRMLAETAERIFRDHCTRAVHDASERGEWAAALWDAFRGAGLHLTGRSEERGGPGGELADRLVSMRPELRVLFMTGYDDEEMAERGLVGPRRDCLTKPFPAVELRARVRALVSGAPRAR